MSDVMYYCHGDHSVAICVTSLISFGLLGFVMASTLALVLACMGSAMAEKCFCKSENRDPLLTAYNKS